MTDFILGTILLVGVLGLFYLFYKLLASGFKALMKHDD